MPEMIEKQETVLVSGGSGFIGVHCILQLLDAGYRVRTTLRSLQREAEVLAMLKTGGARNTQSLSFYQADLLSDDGWNEAVSGCDYVLHVASPFPAAVPKHEDELIVPAREGTLRVLTAARYAGVRRVVLTSSFAAIAYGHEQTDKVYTEESWTNSDHPKVTAYIKSKTLAERAAWDFLSRDGGALELTTVNPVGVMGPVLGLDNSASIEYVLRMMNGALPGSPRLCLNIVDVRDVADLHLRAMLHPAANGERFLAVAGDFMPLHSIALLLRARLGDSARLVPSGTMPDWMIKLVALFDPAVAQVVTDLGKYKNASNEKARRMLGWSPRSNEEAIIATAESMLKLGLLKVSKKS